MQAIHQYGAGRGAWLALRRVLRCHPFQPGGYDPLPSNVFCQTGKTRLVDVMAPLADESQTTPEE